MATEGRWAELVEDLGGSAEAKRRFALILETLAGHRTVRGAARLLGLGARRFHILRRQFLEESVDRLEPRAPGRPGREPEAVDGRIAALQEELQRLRIELQAAQIREEIALAMPHLLQRSRTPKKPPARKNRRARPSPAPRPATSSASGPSAGPAGR